MSNGDNIHISDINNAVINVGSTIGDITNTVTNYGAANSDQLQEKLSSLISKLEQEIKVLATTYQEEAETLNNRMNFVLNELKGKKPDLETINYGISSLHKVALLEHVQTAAPRIFPITQNLKTLIEHIL